MDQESEELFSTVQQMVSSIRNIQAEMGFSPKVPLNIFLKPKEIGLKDSFESTEWIFRKLIAVESITVNPEITKPPASASAVVDGSELYIPLEGLIDLGKERERIKKEIENTKGFLQSVEKKLANDQFVENAPAEVVERERHKQQDAGSKLEKLQSLFDDLETD